MFEKYNEEMLWNPEKFHNEKFVILSQIGDEFDWSWEEVEYTDSYKKVKKLGRLEGTRVFAGSKELFFDKIKYCIRWTEANGISSILADTFSEAKKWADSCDGYVYLVKNGEMLDRIYPKPSQPVGWQSINDLLCDVFVNKIQPCMFKYVVHGIDCNGAGETETWLEPEQYTRQSALKLKHKIEEESPMGYIEVIVRGREKEHYDRICRNETSWMDDEDDCPRNCEKCWHTNCADHPVNH